MALVEWQQKAKDLGIKFVGRKKVLVLADIAKAEKATVDPTPAPTPKPKPKPKPKAVAPKPAKKAGRKPVAGWEGRVQYHLGLRGSRQHRMYYAAQWRSGRALLCARCGAVVEEFSSAQAGFDIPSCGDCKSAINAIKA